MKIDYALISTGKAHRPTDIRSYVMVDENDVLFWYGTTKNNKGAQVMLSEILGEVWQPYHEVKEIRPEKAGELWEREGLFFVIVRDTSNNNLMIRCCEDDYLWSINNHSFTPMIHNKNGWKRLFPEPEDDSVERIEFSEVEWSKDKAILGFIYPSLNVKGNNGGLWNLLDRPPMKMILEIPKDKS